MAYIKLDSKGKPIPKNGRSKRLPAEKEERGIPLFHYRIYVSRKLENGKYKQVLRHMWLPDDLAAAEAERELKRKAPVKALTWQGGYELWLEERKKGLSPRHLANVAATMKRWNEAFGVNMAIEATELAEFTSWLRERSKTGKGRGAQLDYAHLMTIARWCQEQGAVDKLPFEHAPQPKDRMDERKPAEMEEFYAGVELLPHHIGLLWRLLGVTGMRLGAACTLLEDEITDSEFTVTTKGDERVTFPIQPMVREIIDAAHAWKAEHGFQNKPYLFCNIRGERWTPKSVGKRIAQYLDGKAGRPKVTSHQLRHMAGTTLGENNASAATIMATLHHKNIQSSMVYTHKTKKMRSKGMNTLIENLYKNDPSREFPTVFLDDDDLRKISEGVVIACPDCRHKLLIIKKKEAQP